MPPLRHADAIISHALMPRAAMARELCYRRLLFTAYDYYYYIIFMLHYFITERPTLMSAITPLLMPPYAINIIAEPLFWLMPPHWLPFSFSPCCAMPLCHAALIALLPPLFSRLQRHIRERRHERCYYYWRHAERRRCHHYYIIISLLSAINIISLLFYIIICYAISPLRHMLRALRHKAHYYYATPMT
jgi:hypothetical protein